MWQHVLDVAMRYLHVVSAIVAVGGLAFAALCLTPAVRVLDDSFRASVMKLVQLRFRRVVWVAIFGLIVTGTYNWVRAAEHYKDLGAKANALIGTKVLLAMVLFAIVAAESVGWLKPKKPTALTTVKLALAAVVILLGSILRKM